MHFYDEYKTYLHKLNNKRVAFTSAGIFIFLALWNILSVFAGLHTSSVIQAQISNLKFEVLPNIADMHLFGFHPLALNPNDLPMTSLNVTLIGVFAAKPEKYAKAVIIDNGQQKLVGIGDSVANIAKVIRILPNSIILLHNGMYESLSLPKPDFNGNTLPAHLNFPVTIEQ